MRKKVVKKRVTRWKLRRKSFVNEAEWLGVRKSVASLKT
jgi:hypothetical protein